MLISDCFREGDWLIDFKLHIKFILGSNGANTQIRQMYAMLGFRDIGKHVKGHANCSNVLYKGQILKILRFEWKWSQIIQLDTESHKTGNLVAVWGVKGELSHIAIQLHQLKFDRIQLIYDNNYYLTYDKLFYIFDIFYIIMVQFEINGLKSVTAP